MAGPARLWLSFEGRIGPAQAATAATAATKGTGASALAYFRKERRVVGMVGLSGLAMRATRGTLPSALSEGKFRRLGRPILIPYLKDRSQLVSTTVELLLIGTAAMVAMMFSLWLLHLAIANAAVVDVGWAAGIGVLALLYARLGDGDPVRRAMIGVLGGVWSARLTLHLAHRVAGEPEDGRYREIRERWRTNVKAKFFAFFVGQGVLDVLLATPFLLAVRNPDPRISLFEIAGVMVWVIALAGETAADHQLRAFKADAANKGRVCQVGLWRWSRHPNYFFEWLIWCAFALFALGSPLGWLAVGCPALMLYFLLRVTGIPATEAHALNSRGAEYAEYQRTTSAFIPLPRKENRPATR